MFQCSLSNYIFNFFLHPQISSKMKLCCFIKLSRCHLRKKKSNLSIIPNVSFMSDTAMLKYISYKNFHLFPLSCQPMQPFLSFHLWSNFSKEIVHFFILCPLLSQNNLSTPYQSVLTVSQSPLASF